MAKTSNLIAVQRIEKRIAWVRDEKVMLDVDLADLYGVPTKRLNEAVKRNLDRFPTDFMFQLTADEVEHLRSQYATSSHGGRRTLPYAFTEQGVAMLSSVLRSDRAVQVNVEIMRTFVRLRQLMSTHADLARKLAALEGKYDRQFAVDFQAIKQLMKDDRDCPSPYSTKKKRIGYA